ncbi:ankyrin [Amniculicola lignicola CBS 123094]|uniref:Ankyrin n=1 Tax=Amniculicola lignicola CBS 123094 TaxID=1392246 RepID=A0A6A5X1Q4_9PLEO|nr:ankyrin [Amniculicola lignicola CBS 123094]
MYPDHWSPGSDRRAISQTPPWANDALLSACSAGNLSRLRMHLRTREMTDDDSQELLFRLLLEATKKRHVAVVEYLLQQIKSTDFPHDIIDSAVGAGLEIYRLFHTKNPDIIHHEHERLGDAVCWAVSACDPEFLSYLLDNGADPGRSLRLSPRIWCVELPIEYTVLVLRELHEHQAVAYGHDYYREYMAILRLLLQHGAVINGANAIQQAGFYGRVEVLEILIDAGGDVNWVLDPYSKDPELETTARPFCEIQGQELYGTALHYAASNGHFETVKFLLDHGADPLKKDSLGASASERAQEYGHLEIVSLIECLTHP